MLTFDLLLPLKLNHKWPVYIFVHVLDALPIISCGFQRYQHVSYSYAGVVVAVIHVDVASCPFSDW